MVYVCEGLRGEFGCDFLVLELAVAPGLLEDRVLKVWLCFLRDSRSAEEYHVVVGVILVN
jgi:hypothetical protein